MKVLVACEFSGVVREAFRKRGHDAWSCDLLPTDVKGPHIQGDVIGQLDKGWDLLVAHPPCTFLTVSANKWHLPEYKDRFPTREQDRAGAIEFFMLFATCGIPRIAIENPIGIMSSRWRKPNQVVQPWMFGHMETKATCLWLKGLPCLRPTNNVKAETMALPRNQRMRLHYLPKTVDRWKLRSVTYWGIADAMAAQWGTAEGITLKGRN